jgi:hypothetical protein
MRATRVVSALYEQKGAGGTRVKVEVAGRPAASERRVIEKRIRVGVGVADGLAVPAN